MPRVAIRCSATRRTTARRSCSHPELKRGERCIERPGARPGRGDEVAFVPTGKPVASICHGPWTLPQADAVRGRQPTSWSRLWLDLRQAGAEVIDQEVVIDGQLTTSRLPTDLPAFCAAIVE